MEIEEDAELTNLLPDIRGSKVEVVANGKNYNSRVDYSLGEPENPMSDSDIIEKFKGLAAFAEIDKDSASMIVEKVFSGEVVLKF